MRVHHPFPSLFLPALSLAGLSVGCSVFASSEPSTARGDEATSTSQSFPDGCPASAAIDDAEDSDDQIKQEKGRGGYFYTYVDDKGSSVEPSPGSFRMTENGYDGSSFAIRLTGTLAQGEVYAGVGLGFLNPEAAYDASQYRGISFMAKKGKGTDGRLRLKVPDQNTHPDGSVCKECYNDFGIDFMLTDTWTRYTVQFSDLKQSTGVGEPRPANVDPTHLYGLQWQVASANASYEVWLDDIRFTGCD